MKRSLKKILGTFLVMLPFIALVIAIFIVAGWSALLMLLCTLGIAFIIVIVLALGLTLLEDDPDDQKTT